VIAAAWAVVVGVAALIVLALVVWAADSASTANAGGAMQFAVQLWLLAHRVALRIPTGGALTIPPMLLTLSIGALIARGAAIIARSAECREIRDIGAIAGAVTAPYAVMATLLAVLAPSASLRPSIAAAFINSLVIAFIAAAIGATRGSGLAGSTWRAMPAETRSVLAGGVRASAVLFGAATVLAVGTLLAHLHEFGSIAGDYNGGAGAFAMAALSVLMVPNAVCFAVGYISGPGFAIGSGTSVTYTSVHLGAVPAFPLLAAVPNGAAPRQIMALFLAAVVGAGVVAGLRVARVTEAALRTRLQLAALVGVVVGVVVTAIVGFAGGPGGPGRLSSVGPSPWQVGFATAAEVAVTAAITVGIAGAVRRARSSA
jgi:hypothetical protein